MSPSPAAEASHARDAESHADRIRVYAHIAAICIRITLAKRTLFAVSLCDLSTQTGESGGPHRETESGRAMNKADEKVLAWRLIGSAGALLDPSAHAWLCVKIGAGEPECAIEELLAFFAHSGVALPKELVAALCEWMRGYAGSENERLLQHLIRRIKVSGSGPVAGPSSGNGRHRARLVARRPDRAKQVTLAQKPPPS